MHDKILDLLRRGETDAALQQARAAAVATPEDPGAYRLLAMALQHSGEVDQAMHAVDRGISLAPHDAELHLVHATLLMGQHRYEEARVALFEATDSDPNQYGAYILQAQLAFGRGDLDEARRQSLLAARIAPEHPWTLAIDGMLALQTGDAETALGLLVKAAEAAPNDAQVRLALAMAYLQRGHYAFAEQALRGLLREDSTKQDSLRILLANVLLRQNRPGEGFDVLQLQPGDASIPYPLRLFAADLALKAGRGNEVLPLLRASLAERPGDERVLAAISEVWWRTGDRADAINTLDAALATSPGIDVLWQARLRFHDGDAVSALAIVNRWEKAMPESIAATEAHMRIADMAGDESAAQAAAERLVSLQPGHGPGELRVIQGMQKRDPGAAVAYIEGLLQHAQVDSSRRLLREWLALAQDRAGRYEQAAETWTALQAEAAAQRLPLPEFSSWAAEGNLPATEAAADAPAVTFLTGAPGSRVEQLALVLQAVIQGFRIDRFGAQPPRDGFQDYRSPFALAEGKIDAGAFVAQWREGLPTRGVPSGEIVDWLLWWDNAWVPAISRHVPGAGLLVALRDPRDMLLDWLAFGAPAPFRIESPRAAAQWLARQLEQFAELGESGALPHHILRLDEGAQDSARLLEVLSEVLETPMPPVHVELAPLHFPAGHWRDYRDALGEAFALLAPVAVRLGYPAD